MWFRCELCGHETQSDEDITGEDCIAGFDFVADPALHQRVRRDEPSLVCAGDQEKYMERYFPMDDRK